MIFQHFPNTNVWEGKFDLDVKKVNGQFTVILLINLVDLKSSMLYTKIQLQSILDSGEDEYSLLLCVLFYEAILFSDVELFEQIDNTLSTEGPWNLVKIAQAVSEKTY